MRQTKSPRPKKKAANGVCLGRWRAVSAVTGLTHSGIYRTMEIDPSFPRPVKLNDDGRAVAWPMNEIGEWVAGRLERGRIDWDQNTARAAAKHARSARTKLKPAL